MGSRRAKREPRASAEANLYDLLTRLDRLEELREDMVELGIDDRAQLESLIADLNTQLDALPNPDATT